MESELLRKRLKETLLTSIQVASRLGISKQSVFDLVKKGELLPALETANGALFFLSEIIELQQKSSFKSKRVEDNFLWCKGNTFESKDFFNINISKLGKVVFIEVARTNYFLICDGYYNAKYTFESNLKKVEAPCMVLKDENGNQMWLNGCNCGYGGCGPNRSLEILKYFEIDKSVLNLENLLFSCQKLEFYLDNNKWECISFPMEDWNKISNSDSEIYSRNGRLIKLMDLRLSWELSYYYNPLNWINMFYEFIPSPQKVYLLHDNQAYFEDLQHSQFYNVIIEDRSGNQIWLRIDLDFSTIKKNNLTIKYLLESAGLNVNFIEKQSGINKLKNWLLSTPTKGVTKFYIDKEVQTNHE